jgi:hypothetical protein
MDARNKINHNLLKTDSPMVKRTSLERGDQELSNGINSHQKYSRLVAKSSFENVNLKILLEKGAFSLQFIPSGFENLDETYHKCSTT